MNRPIDLKFNTIPLVMIFMLALSLSYNAYAEKDALINVTANSKSDDSGPAFLNYAKQKQAQESKGPDTPVETKGDNTKTSKNASIKKTKNVSSQALIIAQKDKIIRQLQKQLDARSAVAPSSESQKELIEKIKQLQKNLDVAVAEKEQLLKKKSAVADEKKQDSITSDAIENKLQQQAMKLAATESERQKIEILLTELTIEKQKLIKELATAEKEKRDTAIKLANAESDKQSLTGKLTAEAKEKQLLTEKLAATGSEKQAFVTKLATAETVQQSLQAKLNAAETAQQSLTTKLKATETAHQTLTAKLIVAETAKQDLAAKLTAAATEIQALTAKIDVFSLSKQQTADEKKARQFQADKDKAQLQANADEIKQLKAKLANKVETHQSDKKPASLDLTKESQQQAYAIGASMGDEALKVLSTRNSQGIKVSQDVVLQGIVDSFSGKIALDEKVRNKALFDVSKKVFQNLNKIEQQTLSEGKKYQQKFAKQKGVVLKDGVYSRIDYAGEGKILDSDTVTVTIKETLIDGTVINDMEAEGKVWSQTLKSYPPIFLGPIKRLGNHGSITIVIPSDLAYGSEGKPPKIPPGATMVYEVRIVDATAAEPQAKNP